MFQQIEKYKNLIALQIGLDQICSIYIHHKLGQKNNKKIYKRALFENHNHFLNYYNVKIFLQFRLKIHFYHNKF